MKHSIHFAILFTLLVTGSLKAQQNSQPSSGSSSTSVAPAMHTMTPQEAALTRGDIQMARKEYSQAVAEYKIALQGSAKDALLLNKMGIAYQQLGDLNNAERSYKKAMKADKKFASAVNNLGTLEYQRKRYGRSIHYYKEALKRDEQTATVYSNLGYAYYGNKQYPEAMGAFGKALALDPDVFTKKGGVGAILQQRSAPDPGLFNFLLAKFYAKMGDAEHAAHYLKLSRDYGYKDFRTAEKDPEFAAVIKDPRVQEVLQVPSYLDPNQKPVAN
ncbi:MAG TPA: tetratricopeptide repeat protein [Candidatus Acidoferrales bacterium]|nr:tetratricopeptide repeat protein [Candidatus Acidoferrales bacterium]